MSRTKRYRNWLVWWLQQKRKERNATTSLPDYILAALTYLDGDTYEDGGTTYLQDKSGSDRHFTIVSGTSWDDWVITAPAADATFIAADTDEVFYTSGTPNEISMTEFEDMMGPQYFWTEGKGLVVYDADQTGSTLLKIYSFMGFIAGDIGPYPWPDPATLETPDLYVDADATGAGDGSSWTDAYTTVNAALAAATSGDIIEISGGTSGQVYSLGSYLAITKDITYQGSYETGHNGQVSLEGNLYPHSNSAAVTVINLEHYYDGGANFPVRVRPGTTLNAVDCILGPYTMDANSPFWCEGATLSFTRSILKRSERLGNGNSGLYCSNVTDLTIDNCIIDNHGTVLNQIAGSSTTVTKSLFVNPYYNGPISPFIDIGNSATTDVDISDTSFFGGYPLLSGASSKAPIVNNVFWHKSGSMTDVGDDVKTFDSSDRATITNGITNQIPYFTEPKNGPVGEMILRYDDRNNLDIGVIAATTLNPEVKITHAVDCHGRTSNNRPSAQDIDDMRTLIAGGNEVCTHTATHSDNSSLDMITVSATGTSPTLDVTVSQSGDSTTWTGTLSVTINSVQQDFDLTTTYQSIGDLISALSGASIGDGTVTCTKSISNDSNYMHSCCLEAVSSQSISSAYDAQKDDDAFIRYEITEAIADLEAYVNDGEDRNGSNAVTGMSVEAPAETFVCKSYAAPYGLGRPSVTAALAASDNVIIGNQAGGLTIVNSGNMVKGLGLNSIYQFAYQQMTSDQTVDLFAMACTAASGAQVYAPLWHGGQPDWGGGLQEFKEMMVYFGLGSRTFAEYGEYLLDDGGWTLTDGHLLEFVGDLEDYLYQGDYTLQSSSPLKEQATLERE